MATVALNFNGPISHPATTKLRNSLCASVTELLPDGKRKFDKLYLFMNSGGGSLDDGISLFGLIRTLPIEVTTINTGLIASIAIAPFLAGKKRVAFPGSRFHFHDFEWNYGTPHNLTRLEYLDHTQILEAARQFTFEILKQNTSLTDDDLQRLKLLDIPTIQDAAFAKERGIVHQVDYFPLPENTQIFNVDY